MAGTNAEAEAPGDGGIRIDPVVVQNIGVQSEPIRREDIAFSLRTVGRLIYDDRQIHDVTVKYEGWIEKTHVHYVGEPVERSQALFEIYSPEMVAAQKEYLQAFSYAEQMEASQYADAAERARALLDASICSA